MKQAIHGRRAIEKTHHGTCSEEHARDRRGLQRREEAAKHGGKANACNDLPAAGRQGGEDANLDAQAGEVRKPAEAVRGDRMRACAERVRALHDGLEVRVANELVHDEPCREQLRDGHDLVPRDTHEDRDWVEDIAEYELHRQVVDPEPTPDPSQQPVHGRDERKDCEHVRPTRVSAGRRL
jgi:hypothetical protein